MEIMAPSAEPDRTQMLLVERVLNGERHLFYELIRPCERSAYLAAFSLLANEDDAEEVAQEGIYKAFKHLRQFRAAAKICTWLIQIVINEARMRRRKDRKHLYESIDEIRENEDGDYTPRELADWREIPSEALERAEIREALAKALDSLPEKYRAVFVLRDVQNLNIAETSEALGITPGAVKTRLLRAGLQMRDFLVRR